MSNFDLDRLQEDGPSNVSDFEREQLRFFLSDDDLGNILATLNPSLAWLPIFGEMGLIKHDNQLIAWIERNLASRRAVTDVVANLRFFGREAAEGLEFCLRTQAPTLPELLAKCWRLIIRDRKGVAPRWLRDNWYLIATQVKNSDHTPDLLERLARILRPEPKLGSLIALRGELIQEATFPSDVMSIRYEVAEGVLPDEILQAWPSDRAAQVDVDLLKHLSDALENALADAADAGVEGNEAFSASDVDVPSVARHDQNAYRNGFQPIVRVIAELWTRLAKKSPQLAISFAQRWRGSNHRLAGC